MDVYRNQIIVWISLIGLRTIVANKLRLVIDGDRRQATLRTKGWLLRGRA